MLFTIYLLNGKGNDEYQAMNKPPRENEMKRKPATSTRLPNFIGACSYKFN